MVLETGINPSSFKMHNRISQADNSSGQSSHSKSNSAVRDMAGFEDLSSQQSEVLLKARLSEDIEEQSPID